MHWLLLFQGLEVNESFQGPPGSGEQNQPFSPDSPTTMDGVLENFFTPGMAIKVGVIILASPIWMPIVRVLWAELRGSISDDSDAFAPSHLSPQPPPKTDGNPWVSIPYALYRKHGRAAAAQEAGRQSGAEFDARSVKPQARRGAEQAKRRGTGSRGGF